MPKPMKSDRRKVQFTVTVEVPIGMSNLRARDLVDSILKDGYLEATIPRALSAYDNDGANALAAEVESIKIQRAYVVPAPKPTKPVLTYRDCH